MRDPVLLPSSRQIVDRKTIKQQLLSVPQDPFNRSQLAIEDVIPGTSARHTNVPSAIILSCLRLSEVELKARIEAFLAERKGQRTGALDKPEASEREEEVRERVAGGEQSRERV